LIFRFLYGTWEKNALLNVKKRGGGLCSRGGEITAILLGKDSGKEQWAASLTAKQYRHLRKPKCWGRRW